MKNLSFQTKYILALFAILIVVTSLLFLSGCSDIAASEIEPETDVPDTEIIVKIPVDKCVGDQLKEYTGEYYVDENDIIHYPYHSEICPVGCYQDMEGAYCKDPCENIECPELEIKKACETLNFLVEYKNVCAEIDKAPFYECTPIVGTRTLCGCYDATDEEPAHCYGE